MTSQLLFEISLLVVSYIFGSIPFSIIFGKFFKGIDVREHGSGNPGGTNSIRFLGRKVGFLVVFFDGLKGGLIILLIRLGVLHIEYVPILAFGTIAALGHVFSIFIGFRGGKAVAATAGMVTGYNIIWALTVVLSFFLTIKITKYVSIGSTVVPFVLIVLSLIWGINEIQVIPYYGFGSYVTHELPFLLILLLLIMYRHKKNYQNIKNKIEPKISW